MQHEQTHNPPARQQLVGNIYLCRQERKQRETAVPVSMVGSLVVMIGGCCACGERERDELQQCVSPS